MGSENPEIFFAFGSQLDAFISVGILLKVHMKCIFLHNFTVQYVNKSIVNVKVLRNTNLVVILALETAQFLSKNSQETWTSFLCNFIL